MSTTAFPCCKDTTFKRIIRISLTFDYNTYKPGEKLMVDFAGDKLSYVDPDTGEIIKVEVFVACMPYSDYTYVMCVRRRTSCMP